MNSYKKVLKDEIFEKIRRYHEINRERADIEDENPDVGIPDLCEIDDEYAGLSGETIVIQEEIDALLLETKYAPLVGLSNRELKTLRFFKRSSDLNFEQTIDRYLNNELLLLAGEMRRRLKKIRPLLLKNYLSPFVYNMYKQAIKCYIEGLHDASCCLCRAVAEKLVTNFLKNSDFKNELSGPDKHKKGMSIPSMLTALNVKKSIRNDLNIIYGKASKIVHGDDIADEKINYMVIKILQRLIREFPSPPK